MLGGKRFHLEWGNRAKRCTAREEEVLIDMFEFLPYVYLFAVIFLWGTYVVPFKKMRADASYTQFLMCSGILIIAILVSFLFGFSFNISVFGLVSGFMWAIGNLFSLLAIKEIGISRAFPIWISNILVAYAWGVLLFSEITGFGIIIGIVGTLLVFTGSVFITRTKKPKEASLTKGVIFALLTGVLFGTYMVPFKLSGINPGNFYFQISVGIFITSLVIFLLKRKVPQDMQFKNGLLSGILWGIANLFGLYLIIFFGIAKTGPLTQTCVIVGTLWGLFYFKEFKERGKMFRIIMSTLIILAGALLVGLA